MAKMNNQYASVTVSDFQVVRTDCSWICPQNLDWPATPQGKLAVISCNFTERTRQCGNFGVWQAEVTVPCGCPVDVDWPATPAGKLALISCDNVTERSRQCDQYGVWQYE